MFFRTLVVFSFGLMWLPAGVVGAEPTADPALDEAFQKLMGLEPGQDLQQFRPIDQALGAAQRDESIRADIEARLVQVLRGEATDLGKDYACRQLVTVGGDEAIAALRELVPDERMSYMARFGLEGIGGSKAADALRELLGTTEGLQQIGVVISLGRMADAGAATPIAALLDNADRPLADACLTALGQIGTVPAARALQEYVGKEGSSASPAAFDALLAAAESLCQAGQFELAAELCQGLWGAESRRVREGAFRGWIAANPDQSLAIIIAALAGDEDWKRVAAADYVADLRQPAELQQIAAALGDLPAEGQVAALKSLTPRSDPAIRQAALSLATSANVDVAVAALEALILSGTAEDVPALVAIVIDGDDPQKRQAAFETIRRMPADGVDRAVKAWLGKTENPPSVIVQLAVARRSPMLVPALLKAARAPHAVARLEAWLGLEIMAQPQHAAQLVDLLIETAPGPEREAADRAVWLTSLRIEDPAQRSAPLLAALEAGHQNAAVVLLPTLARMGDPAALPAVRNAMQSSQARVRDAGYRALANWPDPIVADELLEIAKTSEVDAYRIWALRAFARLVALPSDRPAAETFRMLRDAMQLTVRIEDKQLFLSRLSAVRVPEALDLLMSYVGDPDLESAAIPAIFTLAKGLSQTHPEQAAAALNKIQPLVTDPEIEQQIPRVLRDIDNR
ncbi:MAG: HEAT repeat domain-containing protein [Planctomycetaceae bacterium]|nr:MAG: HEAT repeat domain-containing protein [Planctomycetaceae bacterium]